MADPSADPFSSDFAVAPPLSSQPADNDDPFVADFKGLNLAPSTSATGAFFRGAERSAVPAIGSLPAIGAGAAAGAEAGAALAPFTGGLSVPVGGFLGGVAGGLGGSYALSKAQDWALSKLPDSWTEKLGLSDRQEKLDEKYHGVASFMGGLVPYAVTMRPGGTATANLPENATALQRVLAHPLTSRVFSGAVMGGLELGQEAAHGEAPDWTKVAVSTGFGVVFNRPTRIGETLENVGGRPVRFAFGRPEPTPVVAPSPAPAAPATQPGAVPAEAAPPSNVVPLRPDLNAAEAQTEILNRDRLGNPILSPEEMKAQFPDATRRYPVTLSDAADLGVMGPGVTEDTFQGSKQRAPEAVETARQGKQLETSVIGPETVPPPIHDLARRMHPELFAEYDRLQQQRSEFANWIDEQNNPTDEAIADAQSKRDLVQQQVDSLLSAAHGYTGGIESRRARANLRDAQRELDTLNERRTAYAEGRAEQTPDLIQARQHLLTTDYALMDMRAQVQAAYRRAAEAGGHEMVEPEAANVPTEAPVPAPEGVAAKTETASPAGEAPAQIPAEPPKPRTIEEQRDFIRNDVARQLRLAGRPKEEAEAAGAIAAARYETRANLFKGALGTPEDLYRREGAEILGPGMRAQQPAPPPGEPRIDSLGRVAPGEYRLPIRHNGEEVGWIEYVVDPDHVELRFPFIEDGFRGKGLGIGAYRQIADWALSHGKELRSGMDVSASAVQMYNALERRGYTVIHGPNEKFNNNGSVIAPERIRVTGRPRQVRHVNEEKLSLVPFLARRGGISPDDPLASDLRGIIGDKLFRKGGMTLDHAREAAAEAGYIVNDGRGGTENRGGGTSTVRTLLDAISQESRGRKIYRPGMEPRPGRVEGPEPTAEDLAEAAKPFEGEDESELMTPEDEEAFVGELYQLKESAKISPLAWQSIENGNRYREFADFWRNGGNAFHFETGSGQKVSVYAAPRSAEEPLNEISFVVNNAMGRRAGNGPRPDFREILNEVRDYVTAYVENAIDNDPKFKGITFRPHGGSNLSTKDAVYGHFAMALAKHFGLDYSTRDLSTRTSVKHEHILTMPEDREALARQININLREKDARELAQGARDGDVAFSDTLPRGKTGETERDVEYQDPDGRIFNYDVHYDGDGNAMVARIRLQMEPEYERDTNGNLRFEEGDVNEENPILKTGSVKRGGAYPASQFLDASEMEAVKTGIGEQERQVLQERANPELFQRPFESTRGGIILNPTSAPGRNFIGVPDVNPILRLTRNANASTFIHESGHQFLGELLRDAEHEAAPDQLKADAQTTLKWLGIEKAGDLARKHQEKFATGFEQYLREGTAPSPGLARVFAQFKNWLVKIYQTIKGLGQPINEDIRGVFDRMLAEEPQRTVIAPEREAPRSMADEHEQDATLTPPEHADATMARVASEDEEAYKRDPNATGLETKLQRFQAENGSEPGGQAGPGGSETSEVLPGAANTGPDTRRGGAGAPAGEEREGGNPPGPQGNRVAGRGAAPGRLPEQQEERAHLDDQPLAPGPAATFAGRETFNVGKKGNIRTENITSFEQFEQAIEEAKDRISGTSEPMTDGQVMDAAQDLGFTPEELTREKLERAFGGVKDLNKKVLAFRMAVRDQAERVGDLMQRIKDDPENDALGVEYAKERTRFDMMMTVLSSVTTEWGRAGRSFRNLDGWDEVMRQGLLSGIKNFTGRELFQLKMEARLGAQYDTPAKVAKYLRDAQKRSFFGMMLEYWINGLISGISTHVTYGIGNTLTTMIDAVPETLMASAIGRARSAMGRQGERVLPGEALQQVRAMGANLPKALQGTLEAVRTGQPTLLPGQAGRPLMPFFGDIGLNLTRNIQNDPVTWHEVTGDLFAAMKAARDGITGGAALVAAGGRAGAPLVGAHWSPLGQIPDVAIRGVPVLPVGSLIRLPGRAVSAIHSFFTIENYSRQIAARAYREGVTTGLDGNALAQHIADRTANPPQDWMEAAHKESYQATLMGAGGKWVQRLSALINTSTHVPGLGAIRPLKFIDPFVHISGNIIEQAVLRRTPLGILSEEIRNDLTGKNGNIAQDYAQARMLMGTAMAVGFGSLAMEGYLTGSGPTDPHQAAAWREVYQPHSVRIGDMWYQMNRLGPMGMLMGIAADMYDVAHDATQGDLLTAAMHLQHAITQNILDESFMRGPSDLIKAVDDPGRYGEAYLRNFAGSFVPFSVGMYQMNRAMDPYTRQARTVMDSILQRVPGMSQTLQPRINVWGEEIPSPQALGAAGMTAIYEKAINTDPVRQAMLDLGIAPAPVERKIRNVELTPQEYTDFARVSGRLAKMRLDAIVKSPDWQTWPAHVRHDVTVEVIRQSREAARGMMMARYPHIVRDAVEAMRQKRLGEPVAIH